MTNGNRNGWPRSRQYLWPTTKENTEKSKERISQVPAHTSITIIALALFWSKSPSKQHHSAILDLQLQLEPLSQRTLLLLNTAVHSLRDNTALITKLDVLLSRQIGEAPLVRDDDVLTAGELELRSAEGLDGVILVLERNDSEIESESLHQLIHVPGP